MVGIVDFLEAKGLLAREPDGSDRRVHTLHLTPDGLTLLGLAVELAMRREQQLCAGLSADERLTLLQLLGRVAANLNIEPGALPDAGKGIIQS